MQIDTPYFRDELAPYNVKHGLVDPSHTFMSPPKKRRNLQLIDMKGDKDRTCEQLQAYRRVTADYDAKAVMRLPEPHDYYPGEQMSPIEKYFKTKRANEDRCQS